MAWYIPAAILATGITLIIGAAWFRRLRWRWLHPADPLNDEIADTQDAQHTDPVVPCEEAGNQDV